MELILTSRRRLNTPDVRDFTPEDMPMETALKVMDIAAKAGTSLLLKGNEPLLYPHLEQFFASVRKRNLDIIPETTGLMPTLARNLVKENCARIFIKVYPPSYYTEDQWKELEENIVVFHEANITLSLICILPDPSDSPDFILRLARRFNIQDILMRLPCHRPPSAMRPFVRWFCENLPVCQREEITLTVDCGLMNCSFTDAELGLLARSGIKLPPCCPHLGILPSGYVAHCWEMIPYPGKHISQIRSEKDFLNYYYDVFKELQWTATQDINCKDCVSRINTICFGVSMAQKADKVLAEYEVFKNIFKKEAEKDAKTMADEERLQNLWELSRHAIMLAHYADAIDGLEELRALKPDLWRPHAFLGLCYWECGRLAESEDEFRKAARLSPDPTTCLAELHHRLVMNGNIIKARMLQAEIEKNLLQRNTTQKN